MHKLTKLCLKKPVSTVIIILALIIFGLSSVLGMNMQLTPDMEMPMVIAYAIYPQASAETVDRELAHKLENVGATIEGLDSIMTQSNENYCYVIYSFDYGTDMDDAYMDLQEELARVDLPDDVESPKLIIMDINAMQSMSVSITSKSGGGVLNYVNDTLEPEVSKISNVASTDVSGGKEEYVSVRVNPEKLKQYGLSMATLGQVVGASGFMMPAGNVSMGDLYLSASSEMEYNEVADIANIPITTGTGKMIHLSDVADVAFSVKEASSIARYNGHDTVRLDITKQQGSNAVELSKKVNKLIDEMSEKYSDMEIIVTYDSAEAILASLKSVAETLVLGIVLSMLVLFIFFGDWKASLIAGSSMPVSLLVTLILMSAMGFSLNIVTMGALVIGIGMMVDNSIVVLEMCFQKKDQGFSFEEAAYDAVKTVVLSITASTITTVVVYLPLALMKGLSGQMFGPLGFTIIFALVSSLISAVTLVPLCFAKYKPIEKKEFVINKAVRKTADVYGKALTSVLRHKFVSALVGIVLMVASIFIVQFIHTELMTATDEGAVQISADIRPGLSLDKRDELLKELEGFVAADENVDNYEVSTSTSGSTMTVYAYLKDDRTKDTADIANDWNKALADMKNCDASCSSSGSSGMGGMGGDSKEIALKCSDLEDLKVATKQLQEDLRGMSGITDITTSFSNSASKAEIIIDPVKATGAGIMPASAAQNLYMVKNGSDAMNVTIDGKDYKVTIEYPKEMYDTVPELMNLPLTNAMGGTVYLSDIAEIRYTDTPQTISRTDKFYQSSVTCLLDKDVQYETKDAIDAFMDEYELPKGVNRAEDTYTEMMTEEFTAIGTAIAIAMWLVFMVMTMQFESARFSFMIMLCIPFSLIGSFFLLLITGSTLSMTSLMGFLMLEGIVVNNGILMVDTTNQYHETMNIETALVEAGKSRLRPILMTTLTTILSMVPLAMGFGRNGKVMQGMAVVIVGGLIASTILTLMLLPTFYMIIRKRSKTEKKGFFFGRKKKLDAPEVDTMSPKDEGVDN